MRFSKSLYHVLLYFTSLSSVLPLSKSLLFTFHFWSPHGINLSEFWDQQHTNKKCLQSTYRVSPQGQSQGITAKTADVLCLHHTHLRSQKSQRRQVSVEKRGSWEWRKGNTGTKTPTQERAQQVRETERNSVSWKQRRDDERCCGRRLAGTRSWKPLDLLNHIKELDFLLCEMGDIECYKQGGSAIRFELKKDGCKTEGTWECL